MAIVHVNGFGTMPVSGDYLTFPNASGSSTYSRETGRYGGYALRHTNTSSGNAQSLAGRIVLPVSLFAGDMSLGLAMNHRAAYTPADAFALALIGSGSETRVDFGTGVANNYPSVASQTSAWTVLNTTPTGTGWHWWNFVFRYHATAGFFRVYRDGVLLAEQQPDTLPFGTTYVSATLFFGNDNGGAKVDIGDVILRNDTTLIPDSVVTSLFPTGTSAAAWIGSDGNSTDNHLLIDEAPTYNAADYVGSATVGAVDTYTLGDLPNSAGTVHAVQVGARAFKSDAGAKTLRTRINAQNGNALDPGGAATVYQLATTSDGSTAWTTATINSATASIEVVS